MSDLDSLFLLYRMMAVMPLGEATNVVAFIEGKPIGNTITGTARWNRPRIAATGGPLTEPERERLRQIVKTARLPSPCPGLLC